MPSIDSVIEITNLLVIMYTLLNSAVGLLHVIMKGKTGLTYEDG
jgi:hypothetical protein